MVPERQNEIKGDREMDYVEAATQLGQAIAESGEFLHWRESESAVLADEKAQTLIREFRELQTEMVKASGREDITKEGLENVRDTLLSKQNELNAYEITKQYFDARQGFEIMMKTVNEILQYYIDGQLGGSCGGDCHSCGGCH